MRYCEKELPFTVLQKAVEGNPDAIAHILKHYDGYLNSLSKRPIQTKKGEDCFVIDEDWKAQLQEKIIKAIPRFRLDDILKGTYPTKRYTSKDRRTATYDD